MKRNLNPIFLLFTFALSIMFAQSAQQDSLLGSARVVFQDIRTGQIIGRGTESGGLYYVDEVNSSGKVMLAHGTKERDAWLWHRRLGHPSTNYGDIEFGFYPSVAPQTVEHIYKLVRLGCYNTNHFFRVDKGFVAQVADVSGGRTAPMNEEQRKEAVKTIKGEFSDVKHVRGILSMGRYSDPNSAQSSFSMLLGDAPHLDHEYAIFGKVTKGDETLKKLEELPTRREGIFVMTTERITILSTYYYDTEMETCQQDKSVLKRRLAASAVEIERQRMKCFP